MGSVSAGAVHALMRSDEPGNEGLAVVPAVIRLVAETTCVPSQHGEPEIEQVERYYIMLIHRYGTLRRAMEAVGTGKRRHPLVSPDRARSWHQTLSALAAVAEQTLTHHATLNVALSKWIAAQGDALERRLDQYLAWLDGPLPEEDDPSAWVGGAASGADHRPGTARAAKIAGDQPAELTDEQKRDLALIRAEWLGDKRPSEPVAGRRMPAAVRDAVERMKPCTDHAARAIVAIALGRFGEADIELPLLDGRTDRADYLALQGDRLFWEKRFDDAAAVYRQARAARDDFTARRDLAMALVRSVRGSAEAHVKEAIDLMTDALRGVPKGTREWRRGRALLGQVWLHVHAGDRDANLRRAIECAESAIEGQSRDDDPEWWAETHLHLGSAWQALPSGRQVENVQRAITCFNRAAEVWTRETHPDQWAAIQNHLGHAWERLPTGVRSANIRRAIEFFTAALSVRTRESQPASWAQLQNNLGNAWIQCPSDSPEEHKANIERAIACHAAALEVWSQQERRFEWAATQNNLGNAWALLPAEGDEREKNLRRAIACYKAALGVRTRTATPVEWASTNNNLGNALLALPGASGGSHIDEAIDCFRKALEIRTRQAFPVDWAKTRANLGHAYARLDDDERRENLEEAALCYESALEVLTAAAYPHQHEHVMARLEDVRAELRRVRG